MNVIASILLLLIIILYKGNIKSNQSDAGSDSGSETIVKYTIAIETYIRHIVQIVYLRLVDAKLCHISNGCFIVLQISYL